MKSALDFIREQSLSIAFGVLFLGALIAQAIAGHAAHNNEQRTHGDEAISRLDFLTSPHFGRVEIAG